MINIKIETDPNQVSLNSHIITASLNTFFHSYQIKDTDITVIFGDDNLLNQLKKKYFKVDQLTDVIAFRYNSDEEPSIEGEIYISLPRAKENANKYKEPLQKEIMRLVYHGGLHLMGYEDKTSKEKEEMTSSEDKYLTQIPWDNLLEMDNQ